MTELCLCLPTPKSTYMNVYVHSIYYAQAKITQDNDRSPGPTRVTGLTRQTLKMLRLSLCLGPQGDYSSVPAVRG